MDSTRNRIYELYRKKYRKRGNDLRRTEIKKIPDLVDILLLEPGFIQLERVVPAPVDSARYPLHLREVLQSRPGHPQGAEETHETMGRHVFLCTKKGRCCLKAASSQQVWQVSGVGNRKLRKWYIYLRYIQYVCCKYPCTAGKKERGKIT